jgi:hypothetical protein
MKYFLSVVFLFSAILIFSSCSGIRYFQIYDISAKEGRNDNQLEFNENEVQIVYNFWEEGGRMSVSTGIKFPKITGLIFPV